MPVCSTNLCHMAVGKDVDAAVGAVERFRSAGILPSVRMRQTSVASSDTGKATWSKDFKRKAFCRCCRSERAGVSDQTSAQQTQRHRQRRPDRAGDKSSVEQLNRLIRRRYPKRTDCWSLAQSHIDALHDQVNRFSLRVNHAQALIIFLPELQNSNRATPLLAAFGGCQRGEKAKLSVAPLSEIFV